MRFSVALLVLFLVVTAGCSQHIASSPLPAAPQQGAFAPQVPMAQVFKSLYSFAGNPDGSGPYGGLIAVNGVLYGTTRYGGKNDNGSVFKVTTSGAEHILHSFGGTPDAANPVTGLTAVNGTLYGTTEYGGKNNLGAVFKVTTAGVEHVLYSFKGGSDGEYPWAGVVALNGTLYGTTYSAGKYGNGVIFKVTTSGAERVIHAFNVTDGAQPLSRG